MTVNVERASEITPHLTSPIKGEEEHCGPFLTRGV